MFLACDHAGDLRVALLSPVSKFTIAVGTMSKKTVAVLRETFANCLSMSDDELRVVNSLRFLDMACDIIHYSGKIGASTVKQEVGFVSTQVAVARALKIGVESPVVDTSTHAPSVKSQIRDIVDLTQSNMWKSQRPFVDVDPDFAGDQKWWDALPPSLVSRSHSSRAKFAAPISTAAHEDVQLEYDRVGVPLCSLGGCNMCAAQKMSPNHGPLHVYLSADDQHLVDCIVDECVKMNPEPASLEQFQAQVADMVRQRVHIDCTATCLLCIRRDVSAIILSISAMLSNCELQVERGSVLPPPFCNPFNVPGGYSKKCMALDCGRVFGNIEIVGSQSCKLPCRPFCKMVGGLQINTWRFDQSSIKYNSDNRLND